MRLANPQLARDSWNKMMASDAAGRLMASNELSHDKISGIWRYEGWNIAFVGDWVVISDRPALVGLEAALTAFLNSGEVKYSAPPNVGEAELTIVADDRDGFANTGFPPIRLIITDDETDFLAGGNNGDVLNAFDEENGEGKRSVSFASPSP